MINSWLEYKNSLPCPNDMTKSIKEMLDNIEQQEINPRELDDLMLAQEVKTITSQGIRFLKSDYYNDTHLFDRISEIYNFTEFEYSDIKQITEEISEVEITKDVAHLIHNKAKSFRQKVLGK